jgi:chemotaxis protein methyltransferase CheR
VELSPVPDNLRRQLRDLVAQQIGLSFPPNRWTDLQRGLAGAVGELGFADLRTGAEWLVSASLTKTQLDVLASHLTIGETYFFREKKTFEVLASEVLPELVSRRKRNRRLRIWSAACCTGEEAYSLAILLRQVIPDLADWFVTILATDINNRFLQKAASGVYGEWSFRGTPSGFKERYFARTENGRYAIRSEIKKQVTFAQVNLVQDVFSSLVVETNAMDLILCRNVLMYFSPEQAQKVIHNLRRSLVHDGWLVVSPSDPSTTLSSSFAAVNFPGVILYQKRSASGEKKLFPATPADLGPAVSSSLKAPLAEAPSLSKAHRQAPAETWSKADRSEAHSIAESLYKSGRYTEVVDSLLPWSNELFTLEVPTVRILARSFANLGMLTDALTWCGRWVNADRLDPSGHYLRAVVLQELGESNQSQRSFQTAIYLDPKFVLAHFALGNLARTRGKTAEANKHFANALDLLSVISSGDVLPETDGITAGRLMEIITSIAALEVAL